MNMIYLLMIAAALSYIGWNIGFAIELVIGGLLYKNNLSIVFIGDAVTELIALFLLMLLLRKQYIYQKRKSLMKAKS